MLATMTKEKMNVKILQHYNMIEKIVATKSIGDIIDGAHLKVVQPKNK